MTRIMNKRNSDTSHWPKSRKKELLCWSIFFWNVFFLLSFHLELDYLTELNSEMISIFIWYFGRCADIAVKRDNPVNPGAHPK